MQVLQPTPVHDTIIITNVTISTNLVYESGAEKSPAVLRIILSIGVISSDIYRV
jgi:hypothetical protein